MYFYTPAFDALNNFSAHQVKILGKHFPTAEHAYQWRKYSENQPKIAKQILETGSPEEAQRVAHRYKKLVPREWHERKVSVMEDILRVKLAQHEDVREVLKRIGKRRIVENSPVDDFWGCGPEGDGENMMGVLWMKIRSEN